MHTVSLGVEVPSGDEGRSPSGGPGDEVPQKLVVFCATRVAFVT